MPAPHYRVNRPRFVDETVDGEALVMDMVKGNYYSCVGASAYAWNALVAGMSPAELAPLIAERYGVSAADAAGDVDRFVATLVDEEMLHPVDAPPDAPSESPVDRAALDAAVPPGEYGGLTLERFTDLADLILLDPVHDVSEVGWPHTTPEA
jgi:hypothetical protein